MYDYSAADNDEVSFKDGDVIVNVQAIDEGWMYGTVQRTGKTGMLPANYHELKTGERGRTPHWCAPRARTKRQLTASRNEAKAEIKSNQTTVRDPGTHKLSEATTGKCLSPLITYVMSKFVQMPNISCSECCVQEHSKTVRAMYDYSAADNHEVSFKDGDVIVNVQAIDEGWMYGTVQRTGKTGMLPANYVEAV
uniref:SH3 domain-containing protein n=1 Tax=Neogobius melanostomus TaxID=47308 RepID=A0A8C6SGU5_9GOBI